MSPDGTVAASSPTPAGQAIAPGRICLAWHSSCRFRVHVDVATGSARLGRSGCGHQVVGGAQRVGGRWCLLRAEGGELVLQVDRQAARFGEIARISVEPAGWGRRRARVESPALSLDLTYFSLADVLWRHVDPTWDGLDDELGDFFVWVRALWRSSGQGRELAELWSAKNEVFPRPPS